MWSEISCCYFQVMTVVYCCGCIHGYDDIQQTDSVLLCVKDKQPINVGIDGFVIDSV